MKKFLLSLIVLAFSVGINAQHFHELFGSHKCSHQKIAESAMRADPNQSPLVHDYDVKFYHLDINVENNTIDVSGNVTFYAEVTAAALDTFCFELMPELVIDSVIFEGTNITTSRDGNNAYVDVAGQGLVEGDFFTAVLYYGGTPPTGGFFSGISTAFSSNWGKNVTWTLSEPYNAMQWWPTKQVLPDKADSVFVYLTTSDGNLAGSNGLLTATVPLPNNKVRYEWKSFYPINYYLISFAVAEYQEYNIYAHPEGLTDSIFIQNYIYDSPGCLENYKDGIDNTIAFMELFSDLFGMYPFAGEKYGHCISEMGGAMEHQTMTTTGYFGFGIIAHELGHQWFGDNVTCATWSDIFINEGFATYSDYLAHEYVAGGTWPEIWMENTHNYVMSSPGGSVYVPPDQATPDNVWRIFDGRLSYNKGASILHIMRFEIQDDSLFFAGLENFQNEFADDVATGDDFRESMENTTGMDFEDFFDQWYYGEGYPTYDIGWNQSDDTLFFTAYQSTSTSVTPLFKMLMEYKIEFTDGSDTLIKVYQTTNEDRFEVLVNGTVDDIVVDPNNWVLNKVGWVSVNIEHPQNALKISIGPNPVKTYMTIHINNEYSVGYELEIHDLSGRLIQSEQLSGTTSQIDLSKLKQGMYIVDVFSNGLKHSSKIIKY